MEAGGIHLSMPLSGEIWSVAFSPWHPDGDRGSDYTIRLWDPVTGQELLNVQGDVLGGKLYPPVAFSPDGRRILVACIGVGFLILDATPWAAAGDGK